MLVSELMLQQTQVARVVPRYEAFLEEFPTIAACAAAPPADVITAWKGLGYNRRALNLHRAARVCVERHASVLPATLDELLALPGIGPYTARAVLAFAHGTDVGVLDVNAQRVLARAFGVTTQAGADALVPGGLGWEWNQAVLDLGATVCTARMPSCDACPLRATCTWATAAPGRPDPWKRGSKQSRFEGSDRQGRGRLLDALRSGTVQRNDVPIACGWPEDRDRALRVLASLARDGLVEIRGETVRLPR